MKGGGKWAEQPSKWASVVLAGSIRVIRLSPHFNDPPEVMPFVSRPMFSFPGAVPDRSTFYYNESHHKGCAAQAEPITPSRQRSLQHGPTNVLLLHGFRKRMQHTCLGPPLGGECTREGHCPPLRNDSELNAPAMLLDLHHVTWRPYFHFVLGQPPSIINISLCRFRYAGWWIGRNLQGGNSNQPIQPMNQPTPASDHSINSMMGFNHIFNHSFLPGGADEAAPDPALPDTTTGTFNDDNPWLHGDALRSLLQDAPLGFIGDSVMLGSFGDVIRFMEWDMLSSDTSDILRHLCCVFQPTLPLPHPSRQRPRPVLHGSAVRVVATR